MTVSINTNTSALTAQRNIASATSRVGDSLSKLSSGSRVPSARDDVAALAVGTRLRSEVQSLQQAQQNVGQGVALLQIADGALNTTSDILTRLQVLAVQSTSGQLSDSERNLIGREYQALSVEVDRIAADTAFNSSTLLSGSATVSSNINDLTGTNLIGEGFADIEFADNFGSGAISFEYNAANNQASVTNLVSGASQTINIGADAIGLGETQALAFNSLGVTISLSDQFDKGANIAAVNTAAAADGAEFTAGQIEAGSIELTGTTLNTPDPADPAVTLDLGRFATSDITITGAAAAATLSIAGFNQDGSATTLEATGVNLSAVGTVSASLTDANGNAIDIEFNITTGYTGTGVTPASNTIDLAELGQVIGATEIASSSTSFTFKVGTGTEAEDDLTVSITAANFTTLAGEAIGNIDTAASAANELGKLRTALDSVTSLRATIGAAQSRLEFAGASIAVAAENTLSAQSSLLDVDVTQELTEFTSSQVLQQAGISLLAQANQQPQQLLSLLQ